MPPATTTKPDNPLDRRIAIMTWYERGMFLGAKSAEEIKDALGGTPRSVTVALRELGFTVAERRKTRRVPTGQGRKTRLVNIPRKWAPPSNLNWPAKARLERQIRLAGASPRAVKNAFRHTAAVSESEMEQALGLLVKDGTPASAPGALKKAVAAIKAEQEAEIAEERRQREYGRDPDLAEALRESPDMPRKALLTRAAGMVRAATRKGTLYR